MKYEELDKLSRGEQFDKIKALCRFQAIIGLCIAVVILIATIALVKRWGGLEELRSVLICLFAVGCIASGWMVVNNLWFLYKQRSLDMPDQLLHWYLLDRVKEAHQATLLRTLMGHSQRAEVGIGKEIDVLHISHYSLFTVHYSLVEPQFDACFFTHHALVPGRFKDQIDVSRRDATNRLYLATHILENEVGSRTVGSSERHIHIHRAIVLHINLIDHAQVVNVDGNLWIIDGFQHIDDALFQLRFLFLCHNIISLRCKVTIFFSYLCRRN